MTSFNITALDIALFRVFIGMGILYFVVAFVDKLRWWNGSDENGNPK